GWAAGSCYNPLRGRGRASPRSCPWTRRAGTGMLTLLLADDHKIVRQGLKALLEAEADFRLVGEASNGLEALRHAERLRPDVLVMDLMMPDLNGLEASRRLGRSCPGTRVVVLSMHS